MAFSLSFYLLLLFFLAFFLSPSSSLGDDAAGNSTLKTYIIGVRNDLKPSVFSDVEHWYSSTLQALSSASDSLEISSRGTRGKRKLLPRDWSPAAIRSALMTTAYFTDNTGQDLVDETWGNASTGWAYGSGHIDPEKALHPGLVYDLTIDDYLEWLCTSNYSGKDIRTIARRDVNCSEKAGKPWDLNYPSIAVVLDKSNVGKLEAVVHRTAMSVEEEKSEYTADIKEPKGVKVVVEPGTLVFDGKGQKQEFVLKVSTGTVDLPAGNSRSEFGSVTWSDGKHTVRSPIAVTWHQPQKGGT